MAVCVFVVGCGCRTGVSDWKGRGALGGPTTLASHSARPEWGGRGGGRRGMPQRKCSMGLHNTRGERAATRRRQPQGLRECPSAASAAAASATAAARPAAGRRHEGRPLRVRRHRERAQGCLPVEPEQWRRVGRVPGAVTGVGPRRRRGRPPRSPPPTGREAESSSSRVATRRGARDGCRDGAVRRRTGGDDEGDGSGRSDPTQESGTVSALGSRAPSQARVHPRLISMAVSRC